MLPLKNCLVTGATGFIGQHLCRFLKEKDCFVRVLLKKKTHLTKGQASRWDQTYFYDLKETILFKSHSPALMDKIDTVFHLAGIAHASAASSVPASTYWRVNVEATKELLHLAHQAGVKRFIYFSSVKAESDARDPYTCSKKAAEEEVLNFAKTTGMHVCILRPALVYGRGVKGNLALMMRGIQRGWFPTLPETKNQRSLISVEDLIKAAFQVAIEDKARGKIYTVTDGVPYSTRQLFDAMLSALGKKQKPFTLPYALFWSAAKVGDLLQWILGPALPWNSERLEKLLGSAFYPDKTIQTELGFKPERDFFQSLPEMVADYKDNR